MPTKVEILDVLTGSKDAIKVASFASDFIFAGKCFSFSRIYTVAGSSSRYFLFDPTGVDSSKLTTVIPPDYTADNGPIKAQIFHSTDYSGGTGVTVNNRAYYSDTTPQATFSVDPTGTTEGTVLTEKLIPATSGGGRTIGFAVSDSLEFVPNPASKYLLKLTNTDTSNADVEISFVWFETEITT